jgi:hypothetical protein
LAEKLRWASMATTDGSDRVARALTLAKLSAGVCGRAFPEVQEFEGFL